jgi:hypothetical protein
VTHPHAPLPYRLEPFSSPEVVGGRTMRAAIAASQVDRSNVHIAVSLGTGKVVRTRSVTLSR